MVCLDLKIFVIQTYLKRCALGSQCPSVPVSQCPNVWVSWCSCVFCPSYMGGEIKHTQKRTLKYGTDMTGLTDTQKLIKRCCPPKNVCFIITIPFLLFLSSFSTLNYNKTLIDDYTKLLPSSLIRL